MKTETFHLELITPCFCGGAEPNKRAEIRAPSIRGQLRWWFRTLGGFKSLAPMPVREQETLIFGSTAGDEGRAGKLVVRVSAPNGGRSAESVQHPAPDMNSPEGYLLFPLRTVQRCRSALPGFDLTALWRGPDAHWKDIRALVAVFGCLGALGFRGRRAMGALAFRSNAPDLKKAMERFGRSQDILIKEVASPSPQSCDQCIDAVANWLKGWRQHGRSPNLALNQPGFDYARRDHNEGLQQLTGSRVTTNPPGHQPKGRDGDVFRAALGIPIIQFFSSRPRGEPNKVTWDWEWNAQRRKGQGRFASPVLLRPHRDAQGNWHALVIFVDAHQWPAGRQVFLNGQPRAVSLALYEAMKNDPALKPYP